MELKRMARVPEPELMDGQAQVDAYAEADFEEPNSRFVALFQRLFATDPPQGTIIDLGCGPGDILIRMAKNFPHCTCLGLDGAGNMLTAATSSVKSEKLDKQISFVLTTLPTNQLPRKKYQTIISNSLLHHLPDPATLWRSISELAAPGCRVLVADLLRPINEREAWELVNTYSGNEPEILRHDFFHSLCAAYTLDEIKEQLHEAGLAALRLDQISDRHFAVWGNITN